MSVTLTELSCPNCGAPLRYRPGSPVQSCPFCGSSIAVSFAQQHGTDVVGETYRMREFVVSRDDSASVQVPKLDALAAFRARSQDTGIRRHRHIEKCSVTPQHLHFVPVFGAVDLDLP